MAILASSSSSVANPFEQRVRFFTRRQLDKAAEYWMVKLRASEQTNDKDGAEEAQEHWSAIQGEIERRRGGRR